jgi:hypothetical protein
VCHVESGVANLGTPPGDLKTRGVVSPILEMFTVADPRPMPTPPVDLPPVATPKRSHEGSSRDGQMPTRVSSSAPDRVQGFHHASLLAALKEEDSDDDDSLFDPMEERAILTSPLRRSGLGGSSSASSDGDSPVSPLATRGGGGGALLADDDDAAADIRVMLASGASAPVEVLRNKVVTSLTLKLKPGFGAKHAGAGDFFKGPRARAGGDVSRRLLLGSNVGDLPKIDELAEEEEEVGFDGAVDGSPKKAAAEDPGKYRDLMMRLRDLEYICIRAAVDVSEAGVVEEREYWLPLEEHQTVADIKALVTGADSLEPDGPKLLDRASGESTADLSMVHAGRELDDSATVEEEGLTHNTVVHLFVKKDANITVKMRGTKDLEVTLTADETAESLRAKLEQMRPGASHLGGLRTSNSQLFFGSQELKDGPLHMYGIADGAALELRPHSSAKMPIPARGAATRHSWNSSAAWKPAGASSNSWASSTLDRGMSIASDSGSSSSSQSYSDSPTAHGSPDVARSFDLARQGLAMGKRPQLARGGTGGAYFLSGGDGETCAVFKPADEEPNARNNPRGRNKPGSGGVPGEGLRKGTRVGEGASREVAAYVLDHAGFAGVPATSLANLCEMRRSPSGKDMGDGKLGSLQAYVRADAEAEELGPHQFPTREVHKITQLDIRLANTDRNAGNILVQKNGGEMNLVPIDHGYALPHTLEDVCFEWEFWPQAKVPYDDDVKAYVERIDVEADVALLREHGLELQPSSERVLRVCTILLKKAAQRGCSPADIAGMMSRPMPNRMSDLEKLTNRAAVAALAATRAEDGRGSPAPAAAAAKDAGNAWAELNGDERAEKRFLSEYETLLDSYLEGFEPEVEH